MGDETAIGSQKYESMIPSGEVREGFTEEMPFELSFEV